MIPAIEPRRVRDEARMLCLDAAVGSFQDAACTDLPSLLDPGDLLIVNDAATIPASLSAGRTEIRLLRHLGAADWNAVLLGPGDWRTPTELRDPPERVNVGGVLDVAPEFSATVTSINDLSGRLVALRFSKEGSAMWSAIYAHGRPIQYSYLRNDLALWDVQTAYASRPWAAEMPSAGQPLSWRILLALKRRGVRIASLTHAAGISAAGEEDVDASLPFVEQFEIPQTTIDAIEAAHRGRHRVIAVGTTVVRALEGSAAVNGGAAKAGRGETGLIIDRIFKPRVIDGILTGVHDPAQSHFRLLRAFADEKLLRSAWRHATEAGYRCHEFGDLCLIASL